MAATWSWKQPFLVVMVYRSYSSKAETVDGNSGYWTVYPYCFKLVANRFTRKAIPGMRYISGFM